MVVIADLLRRNPATQLKNPKHTPENCIEAVGQPAKFTPGNRPTRRARFHP